jgi:hypothetical protein
MASIVPAVSNVNFDSSSCFILGLNIYSQSIVKAILQPETGHSKGVPAIIKPRDAHTIHQKPKSVSQFEDNTAAII